MTLHNPNPNKKLKHYIKQTGNRRTWKLYVSYYASKGCAKIKQPGLVMIKRSSGQCYGKWTLAIVHNQLLERDDLLVE